LTAALRAAQNRRSGGAGRKGISEEGIPAPPSLSAATEFRANEAGAPLKIYTNA